MNNKKKLNILIIGLIIVLASIGLSYAYWQMTLIGDKGNNVTSGCFNIEMINQKDEITLGSTFPITDEEGLKLKPFSFTLKNTCTIFAHYYVNMEMLEGTTLNSKFVAVRVNNEEINTLDTYKTANTTITGSTESRTIAEGYLGADEEIDYTVSFWMDEGVTIDDDVMNKVFKSKIVINSEPGKYDPVSAGYNTLHDAILANEYQTTPEIAKEKIANKQAVDLSNTAPIIKWVEKTGKKITLNVSKPAINSIKSDYATSDLTENDTKLKVYTSYTFDSISGDYTLANPTYVDSEDLEFNNDNHYYYLEESVLYNQNINKLFIGLKDNEANIYEITNASKEETTSTWNETLYSSNTYTLSLIIMDKLELESDKSDKGLYESTDDYGTTYYYRGNIKNNNVYFAGLYWQIIRINGDGSIRILYNGNNKNSTGSNQIVNNVKFNIKANDPAYVGYMYGNPDGTTFDEVHSNTNDSNIKEANDNWYKTNIADKGYSSYVSNSVGFCGDRTLSSGDGIGTGYSYFSTHERYSKNTAQFICQNIERDLYTTTESSIGNKSLMYPVGLITYDELVFSGMNGRKISKLSWTYSSEHYWTMSPTYYASTYGVAINWSQDSYGKVRGWWDVNESIGLRPVINLKSNVKISGGTGTANDPFVIDTNN